jgi:thiaminase
MKKLIAVLTILFTSAFISFAKDTMPDDLKSVTDKITKISAEYYKALTKVKNAKEFAAVINTYADQMNKLAPEIKAMEKKYDYMSGDDEEDSDDMNDYETVQREWAEKMSGDNYGVNFQKFAGYYSDPAVQKALAKLNSVMENLGVSDNEEEYDEGDSEEQ